MPPTSATGSSTSAGQDLPARAGLDEQAALEASRRFGDQSDVPGRDSPFDVAVWRPSSEEHPAWPSPWGWGRPGWHAECAAMAMACVGNSVDVLLGGVDLAFPHHAYQSAIAEAASGVVPFARTVLHVGEVRLDGAKMAKSTQNLVLVGDLLERHSGAAVRLALLNRPWDQPWECTETVFTDAAAVLERLYAAAGSAADTSAAVDDVLGLLVDGARRPRRRGAGARPGRPRGPLPGPDPQAARRPPVLSRGRQPARPGAGATCGQWGWDTWKQATSYCDTDVGFVEFCGCSPAYTVPALPSGLKADPGAVVEPPARVIAVGSPQVCEGCPEPAGFDAAWAAAAPPRTSVPQARTDAVARRMRDMAQRFFR